ncbi:hypothetical protein ACYZUD_16810 [Pseudomonas sp. XS1P51]
MSLDIDKPSRLLFAIADALRLAGLGLKVGGRQDFDGTFDQAWVLIAIEHNAAGDRANDGRIAHVLTVSLQIIVPPTLDDPALAAGDLASVLKGLVTDNRWGLPGSQCDLPMNIDALPSIFISDAREYLAWTLSFTQTLYLGALLLDDPLGIPKFARTWEVSNIDDPDQYTELED